MPDPSGDNFYQNKYVEAANLWNLEKLYEDLLPIKQVVLPGKTKKLTPKEKACLRGFLMGQGPKEISDEFNVAFNGLRTDLSRGLYRIIEGLTNTSFENWWDIPRLLEEAGYKLSPPILIPVEVTSQVAPALPLPIASTGPKIDWGVAPDVPKLYGREAELQLLEQWIVNDHCRVVAIVGLRGIGKTWLVRGGIGKTDLSLKLASSVQQSFDYVIWRRLLYEPSIEEILSDLIKFLSNQQEINLPKSIDAQIDQLVRYLRQHRCLLILDNVETILQSGDRAGQLREGFEGYGQLLKRIGETEHRSCLLLTSREKSQDIEDMEGVHPIRTLELRGLSNHEGRKVFADLGEFRGSDQDWSDLIQFYNGNPLALEIAARHIKSTFDGDIAAFIQQGLSIFHRIRDLLDWHFERLSPSEKEIMYWLAINREPASIAELRADLLSPSAQRQVSETLDRLNLRLPLEKSSGRFTLQPVLIEYVSERLIKQICCEIRTKQINLLNTHALLKASAKDFVRGSQIRLLLKVILSELSIDLERQTSLEDQLNELLAVLKSRYANHAGYAAGNLINLFCQLGTNLNGYDFSHLSIRQAYLQNFSLPRVNFAYSDLSNSVFTQAFGGIHSIAFSSDDNRFAVGDSNGKITVFQADGHQLLTLEGHAKNVWVTSLSFSPDSRLLVSCSFDQTVRLWDVQTGDCLNILQGHENWIWSVAFSPDGKTIASGSYDHSIRLWNATTGDCFKVLQGHENSIWSITFSPDGRRLVSGSLDHTVRLWEVDTGRCLQVLHRHTKEVRAVAISPNGETIASASFDQTIRLWRIATGECFNTLQGHPTGIRAIAFSGDSQTIVSGDNDQTIKLWQVNTGHCLKTLRGYQNFVWSGTFSPDGQSFVTGSLDRAVRIWKVETGEILQTFRGHTNWIWSVAFSPDGQMIASSGDDETIRLWNVKSGKCFRVLQGHAKGGVWSVAFSPDGKVLASGGQDGTVRLWNLDTGESKILEGHTNWIWSVAFSPDGCVLASSSDDQTIRFWNVVNGQEVDCWQSNLVKLMSLAFSPSGEMIASGSGDARVRLWNVQTGASIKTLEGHTNWVMSVAFSPDGRTIASCSSDETIRLWDVSTGECKQLLQGHTNWVRSIAFSPDGQTVASCGADTTIKQWNPCTGQCLSTWQIERPYEGLNISNVTGLTEAQRITLKTLGAVEN